jgi:tRNA-2-methylthio-N6-dimethylallyladenosine synthase
MDEVRYDMAFMFKYSERPKTLAERKYEDDVPEELKGSRLQEVIARQMVHGKERTQALVGQVHRVLIEGTSKKRDDEFFGRTTHNTVVVFPKGDLKPGQYVNVRTTDCSAVTLKGEVTDELAQS